MQGLGLANYTDHIRSLTLSSAEQFVTYVSVSERGMNRGRSVPVSSLKPFLSDCFHSAFCFKASLHEMVNWTNVKENSPITFSVNFYEPGDETGETYLNNVSYYAYTVQQGEELAYSGATNFDTTATKVKILPGEALMANVVTERHTEINNCSADNKKLSKCMDDFLGKKYGGCGFDQVGLLDGCVPEVFFGRCHEMSMIKLSDLNIMKDSTGGCQLPCDRLKYRILTTIHDDHWKIVPASLASNRVDTFLLLNVQMPRRIKNKKEVFSYGFIRFMSEVGGLTGLLLGLSAFGVFSIAVEIVKVFKGFVNKRAIW